MAQVDFLFFNAVLNDATSLVPAEPRGIKKPPTNIFTNTTG